MTSSSEFTVFLAVLALALSAIIIYCFDGAGRLVKALRKESATRQGSFVIEQALLAALKDDSWVFAESLSDSVFDEHNRDVCSAAFALYGEISRHPFYHLKIVEDMLDALQKSGQLEMEEIIFSSENLMKNPELFNSLPEWRTYECRKGLLRAQTKYQGEKVRRVRRRSQGSLSMMKDIGMDT